MRRPWNQVDSNIYALSIQKEEKENINICSYVCPVSLKPKHYMISLEHGSFTNALMHECDVCVLQFLTVDQAGFVRILGKKSGNKYDKIKYLQRKKSSEEWMGHTVLKDCNALLLLKKTHHHPMGDHDVFFFSIIKTKVHDRKNPLTFQYLIQNGIIL